MKLDEDWIGRRVKCPKCADTFEVKLPASKAPPPLPANMDEEDDEIDDVFEDVANRRETSQSKSRRRDEDRSDAGEVFEQRHPTETVAKKAIEDWKAEMPPVPSAYQPSGALPLSAVAFMAGGSVVGAVLGLFVELAVGAISGLIIALLGMLNLLVAVCGFIWCFAVIIFVIIGLIALAAPFIASGWVSAWTTTAFGRWGKNRNVPVPVILSILSTAATVAASWFLFQKVGIPMLENKDIFGLQQAELQYVYMVVFGLGFVIAICTAGFVAADSVMQAKFCEPCGQFMTQSELPTLTLGGMRTMMDALETGRMASAVNLLEDASGQDGKVALFHCPGCGEGYLEVNAQAKTVWHEDGEKSHEETWLVASVPLNDADVNRFRALQPAEDEE